MTLREARYPPVDYLPRDAFDMTPSLRSALSTYCPYKGHASYFDLLPAGDGGANAVWTYVNPFDAVQAIAGPLAFFPDKVSATVRINAGDFAAGPAVTLIRTPMSADKNRPNGEPQMAASRLSLRAVSRS